MDDRTAPPPAQPPAVPPDSGDVAPRSTPAVDPWQALRRFTAARIALGRTGVSQPTASHLDFQLAHARARDAVHHPLATEALRAALSERGHEPLLLHSAAADRRTYLQRPDLGRRLDADSQRRLRERAADPVETDRYDVALVIADGLSAFAIEKNVLPFLDALGPAVAAARWRVAPIAIVGQARVAIGDEVGELLGARLVVVLIGERPGLSSPDSMGIYLTWNPAIGTNDAARNCISNVRPEGLSPVHAAEKLVYLLGEAMRRRLTGVALKDELAAPVPSLPGRNGNFLTGPD
jgi:ethanolamine ammonia-lyase small subunit